MIGSLFPIRTQISLIYSTQNRYNWISIELTNKRKYVDKNNTAHIFRKGFFSYLIILLFELVMFQFIYLWLF